MLNNCVTLRKIRLNDVAPVFNLIHESSHEGHFNPLYLEPRYMAGLGLQLLSLLLLGRIRLPSKTWYRATAKILEVDGAFAGFVILRHSSREDEIYMCALSKMYREKNLGSWMVTNAISDTGAGKRVIADCLPASKTMMRVLIRTGFSLDKNTTPIGVKRYYKMVT